MARGLELWMAGWLGVSTGSARGWHWVGTGLARGCPGSALVQPGGLGWLGVALLGRALPLLLSNESVWNL